MMISKLARKEVKVALGGDAGDELFGGYNRYLIANKYWKIIVSYILQPASFGGLNKTNQIIWLKKIYIHIDID